MPALVFIHGLNTFGDDLIHVGPLTFGPMHRHLEEAFQKRDIEFLVAPEIGAGSPVEQALKVIRWLENHPSIRHQAKEIHLFGQSTGGLVARATYQILCERNNSRTISGDTTHDSSRIQIASVITMGSPHRGAAVANLGMQFAKSHPRLHKIFRMIGYDSDAKTKFFRHFTAEATAEFNTWCRARCQREYSLLCEVEGSDICLPLKALDVFTIKNETQNKGTEKGDAFISSESQKWGEVIGPFHLDHFAQLGVFLHASRMARDRARAEFERLVETTTRLVSSRGNSAI